MLALVTYAYRSRQVPRLISSVDVIKRVLEILREGRWTYAFGWSAVFLQVKDEDDYGSVVRELESFRKETSSKPDGSDGAFDFFSMILRDPKEWDFHPGADALKERSDWKESHHLTKLDTI